MVQPITPREAGELANTRIPDYVFQGINNLITEKFRYGRANFTLTEAVSAIRSVNNEFSQSELSRKGYLDFEEHYRNKGWFVEYDQPAYNESYEPNFKFSARMTAYP
jgi:hypothetical protein